MAVNPNSLFTKKILTGYPFCLIAHYGVGVKTGVVIKSGVSLGKFISDVRIEVKEQEDFRREVD